MNSFPYTSSQIREIVAASKKLRRPELLMEGKPLPFGNYGDRGRKIDLHLDLEDSATLIDLRFRVYAPIFDSPETFEAALILVDRVRGIGWHATGKKRFYKQAIPRGWHQNMIDPNLEPNNSDRNRHVPIKDFEPSDLAAFFMEAARIWHINLPIEKGLL